MLLFLLLLNRFSHVRLLVTPWTVAPQAPPSMGFSRQEYWSGVFFTSKKVLIMNLSRGFPGGSEVKVSASSARDRVRSLGREDPLEKEMATHSSILVWKTPGMEEPGGLQSMGSQRVVSDSDPMDCSPPGSSVHEILQARVLEWGAIAFYDSYLENPINRMKRQKDRTLKDELPRSVRAQYATGD